MIGLNQTGRAPLTPRELSRIQSGRAVREGGGSARAPGPQSRKATASISTRAPMGNAATCTQARAGATAPPNTSA
jgi:hypothetical protein